MRILTKMVGRKDVKAELAKLNEKLKENEFAELFYKELEVRHVSIEDFKRHFYRGGLMISIADDHRYGTLMIEKGATKETCDLKWLKHIIERVEYFQQNAIQNELKSKNVMQSFIKK
ncbi:hypothetical protein J7974_15970 [Vibrio parahaemolyticus]|uniref:hypothetical protein n=1 Tax=Vibrio parahaemolyticus TaxID=670 RepID=UPI0013759B27|nr:hypothetical protein [Vibrio parahaemolyticus]EKL9958507.1 hypothetical protein [Vibrio parahaemolyticus]MBM5246090.1 hypothetical protein [Vibrio parahaemolyticus]MBM5253441.1 hypothetical protein [Vibrio parahaemolyticus]MBM5299209.1 hypothetical protein [Vibrio parahaemolyticus]MBM5302770.1 hypothetical protein [Vibrio parahaemolyticus]